MVLGKTPVFVLVEPQLAENIGMAARAMANFALTEMRIVIPRDWPERGHMKKGAVQAASGAAHILEQAQLYPDLPSALADCHTVYATTARPREQSKEVLEPQEVMTRIASPLADNHTVAILFGRERTGLTNEEIAQADAILSFPINPDFSSLNLAQAVLLVGWEWFRAEKPFSLNKAPSLSLPAPRAMIDAFFLWLEEALEQKGFYPPGKKPGMNNNMRDMLLRMTPREQDIRTLWGALKRLHGE
jgi:tRNA/rRNA methyltransferase